MTHTLKTWPEPFHAVANGLKTFEVRRDDRNFKEGDRLVLQEWVPGEERYTGLEVHMQVVFVGRGEPYPEGYACMGIKEWDN